MAPRVQPESILAWHFLAPDMRLKYKDGRTPVRGRRLKTKDKQPIQLCWNGMHASKSLQHALIYSPGPILCRVRIEGEIKTALDKVAGRYRTILEMTDFSAPMLKTLDAFIVRVNATSKWWKPSAEAWSSYERILKPYLLGQAGAPNGPDLNEVILNDDTNGCGGGILAYVSRMTKNGGLPNELLLGCFNQFSADSDRRWFSTRLLRCAKEAGLLARG